MEEQRKQGIRKRGRGMTQAPHSTSPRTQSWIGLTEKARREGEIKKGRV
jgi:hypothetical protein